MNKVILIGTTHPIQRGALRNPEFKLYIESLLQDYSAYAIAEEIDDAQDSMAKLIADEKKIPYKIIEPTRAERNQLGIPSLNAIENEIFMEFYDKDSEEAISECTRRKEESYRNRESEWLHRLEMLNIWPVIVICGSAHHDPFANLLESSGFEVETPCKEWG